MRMSHIFPGSPPGGGVPAGSSRRARPGRGQDVRPGKWGLLVNLRLARPTACVAELRGALAQARLLDWVDSLPQGLATPVGEQGARLSGGQRQRLALARVLLAGFPVVIFDEPAEHLDAATAAELTRDLLTATEGKTVLLITHRPVPPGTVGQVLRLG